MMKAMSLRRGRLAAIAGSVTAVAAVGLASAGGGAGVADPEGDSSADGPSRDLSFIAHGHSADGRLVHQISVYGELKMKPSKVPLIQIDTEGDNVAEYRVYLSRRGGRVEDVGASTKRGAKVKRVDRHTVKYVFGPGRIGSPGSYDWDVLALSGAGLVDRAPDASQLTHALGP
jgi:hypothetical protein